MPISRSQMPRQMYGLGSLVKSIGKTVKKIVKSPIGKAAILGFGGAGLMGMGPLSALGGLGASSGTGIASILSKGKSLLSGLSGAQKITGALALGGAFAGMEDQQVEELKRNPEALRGYLSQYYRNLNKNATDQEVNEFVESNMTEYKADGGRIGYDDGTNPKKNYLIKKGYGDMVENMSIIEIDELFNSVKGTTTAANTYREPAYMGGRMGYDDGTGDPTYTGNNMEDLPRGLQMDTTTSNPIPDDAARQSAAEIAKYMKGVRDLPTEDGEIEDTETMSTTRFMFEKLLKPRRKEIMENYGLTMKEVDNLIIDEMKKLSRTNEAYGGRMGFAMGNPEENAVQASGIMDLPLNQNPAGITELDLRETGGFIPPVGVKEKADDIPAMLSNNEFVFTADAVRGMGEGNVNKGAQRMYDMMKKLEKGGRV